MRLAEGYDKKGSWLRYEKGLLSLRTPREEQKNLKSLKRFPLANTFIKANMLKLDMDIIF